VVGVASGRRSAGRSLQSGDCSVVLADLDIDAARRVAVGINETHPRRPAVALELDVAEARSVEAAVEKVEAEIGPIDLWFRTREFHAATALATPVIGGGRWTST